MTDGTERTSPLAIADTAANEGSGVSSLDVGGEPVKLDALGPMIINSDGVGDGSDLMLMADTLPHYKLA